MELDKARIEINNIDKEIVKLLERRFNIVNEIGSYKKEHNLPVYDEKREEQVINNCVNFLENKSYSRCIDDIYFQIMRSCKNIQNDLKDGTI